MSRIEVPLTLTPPHFDDEATIATARQVVPIKGAGRILRRGKILTLVPLLIASTLCGALGAVLVNYYDRRREVSAAVTQPQTPPSIPSAAKSEPFPVAAPGLTETDTKSEPASQPKEPEIASAVQPPTGPQEALSKRDEEPKLAPIAVKRESTPDAAKLVRKRRVQPPEGETPPKRKGASGIEDLFGGPNP